MILVFLNLFVATLAQVTCTISGNITASFTLVDNNGTLNVVGTGLFVLFCLFFSTSCATRHATPRSQMLVFFFENKRFTHAHSERPHRRRTRQVLIYFLLFFSLTIFVVVGRHAFFCLAARACVRALLCSVFLIMGHRSSYPLVSKLSKCVRRVCINYFFAAGAISVKTAWLLVAITTRAHEKKEITLYFLSSISYLFIAHTTHHKGPT